MASKQTPSKASPPASKPASRQKAAGIAVPVKGKEPAVKNPTTAKKQTSKPRAVNADAIKKRICEALSDGIPLREVCREAGMPAWRTVYDWMDADEPFAAAIARARDFGHDAIAEESMRIVDAEPERTPSGTVDPGSVSHAKLRAEHRLKLLAKWNPKKYGDKLALGGAEGLPAIETTTRELSDAERAVRLTRVLNDSPAMLAALLAAGGKKAGK